MPIAPTVSDTLAHWGTTCFSEKEVPLGDVVNSLKAGDGRFVLKKSKQYSNNLVLWDNETKDVATVTYGYIVRYASPIQTGNFVPDGKPLPENMMDYLRKSEPSNMAQISVTFDVRMDDSLLEMIISLEDWIIAQKEFDPGQRPRNPWMSPNYIASNMKFTVTSQLFQSKNAFNCKDGAYKVDYPVHPWIRENCVPHNPLWIPNPNVVQFYDVENLTLQRMSESKEPELHGGDVVKMSNKVIVYSGRDTWTASFVPWQILRVGKLDRVDIGPSVQMDDFRPSYLPKEGETITIVAKMSNSGRGSARDPSLSKDSGRKSSSTEPLNVDTSELSDELEADEEDLSDTQLSEEGRKLKAKRREKSGDKNNKVETSGKRKAEDEVDSKKRTLKPRTTRGAH